MEAANFGSKVDEVVAHAGQAEAAQAAAKLQVSHEAVLACQGLLLSA